VAGHRAAKIPSRMSCRVADGSPCMTLGKPLVSPGLGGCQRAAIVANKSVPGF
jgi:hypothetical protein